MAFQSDMGEHNRQPLSRDAGQPLRRDVRSSSLVRKSGILCRGQGQEIGMPNFGRPSAVKGLAAPWSRPDIGSGMAGRDKNDARPEEFPGLQELGGDAPGVENGRIRVSVLTSGSVRGETVLVDDMKEVTHAAELGRRIAGFQ
jgi:hypothetical protein